jgi:regulation of enolase protein 1 (concanavalin A-like superfamily)
MSTQQRIPYYGACGALRLSLLAALVMTGLTLSASAKSKGDIGSPKPEGKSVQQGDTWTVTGGGADIFGPSDQFHFVSTPASGNCVMSAKIVSVGDGSSADWAKGALMIRADESVGAPHASVAISHAGTLAFLIRTTPGGDTRSEKVSGVTFPVFLKIERKGDDFTSSYSADGKKWTMVGKTMTVPMKPACLAGMAVSSHSDGAGCTAIFANYLLRR